MSSEDTLEKLMGELADAATQITTVAELRRYAEHFPSPAAGQIIIAALDYLAEPKVIDGKRDGRKIFEHVNLGYGRQLKGGESLRPQPGTTTDNFPARDILIAISLFTDKIWSSQHELSQHEKITNQKLCGVEDPRELVYKFINLLGDELRKHL